jgi:hypothetical protein
VYVRVCERLEGRNNQEYKGAKKIRDGIKEKEEKERNGYLYGPFGCGCGCCCRLYGME